MYAATINFQLIFECPIISRNEAGAQTNTFENDASDPYLHLPSVSISEKPTCLVEAFRVYSLEEAFQEVAYLKYNNKTPRAQYATWPLSLRSLLLLRHA